MTLVRVKDDESFDSALRRFKKQCEKSGILSEYRRRVYFEKPCIKRKRKALAARKKLIRKFRRFD